MDGLSMIEHLFVSLSFVLHFERFRMLGDCYLNLYKIIFEVQRKRINKKNNKKKIELFKLENMFFFFSFFGSLLLSNLIIFSFFIHLNDLKCYTNVTFKVYWQ